MNEPKDYPNTEKKISPQTMSFLVGMVIMGIVFIVIGGSYYLVTSGIINRAGGQPSSDAPLPQPTFTKFPTQEPLPTFTPINTLTPTSEADDPTPTLTPEPTFARTPLPPLLADSLDRNLLVPILMYHYISVPPDQNDIYRLDLSVTPDDFRDQMQWLSENGYTTISMYDLAYALNTGRPTLPEKPVILTFDDGYRDNYENAFPILKEFGFTGTFFILTDVTDREEPLYMTWDMLTKMYNGGMDIEVHGREHLDMSNRDTDWLTYHLLGPSQTIEANLGYKPRFLAYISGQYDDTTISITQQEGYWAAVTTQHGALHPTDSLYELTRVRVHGDWTMNLFSAVLDGYFSD